MRINGSLYTSSHLKRVSGYVMQDDLLFAHITVIETLQYAAELRLPPDITKEEKKQKVETVIDQLGLENCRNTVVGNAYIRGVSGNFFYNIYLFFQVVSARDFALALSFLQIPSFYFWTNLHLVLTAQQHLLSAIPSNN
jgi:hypothetical protein